MVKNKNWLVPAILLGAVSVNANASLTTVDNGLGVYDSALNLTWTSDAYLFGDMEAGNSNLISTIISDIGNVGAHALSATDFGPSGKVDWWGAEAFVSYLNLINYAGSNQWSLPSAGTNPQFGYNFTNNDLGELFYNELGGSAFKVIPTNAYFSNEQDYGYWFGTEYASNTGFAWIFNTATGVLTNDTKQDQLFVWAVTSATQAIPTPLPAAIWLFGFALAGIGVLGKWRNLSNN